MTLIAKHGTFEIHKGGTPMSFVVHIVSHLQTRFHILFVDGVIANGRESFTLLKYHPHVHLWATNALSKHTATLSLESTDDHVNAAA